MCDVWRESGPEVVHLFGTSRFVPADIVLVHVDLSVVPGRYVEFARRYPIALNTYVRDIRKGAYSQLKLARGDDYDGPVIVKTQRNHGGRPERKLQPFARLRDEPTSVQRRRARQRINAPLPYRIFDRVSDVPTRYFVDPRWLVERFLPNKVDGGYCAHHLYVFGAQYTSHRMTLEDPVVAGAKVQVENCEPHPRAFEFIEQMGLDYGKVDYVVRDGEAFLIDVNKTIGATRAGTNPIFVEGRIRRSVGIFDYLDGSQPLQPRVPALAPASFPAPVGVQPAV
jgi:hypothetical protein